MLKKYFLLLLVLVSCYGNNNGQGSYLNLIATNVVTENNITTASDRVLVFSPEYYITSDKAIYDLNKKILNLYGNVNIVYDNTNHSMGDFASLDVATNKLFQEPAFMINYNNSLWLSSKNMSSDNNETTFECTTILSSCDSDNPFWSLKFSSGFQDKQNQWIHTFNTRLYIKSVPIFYSPYFGFPIDKTRRSGLLRPTLGYSQDEGFLYAQPIYFAPASDWDIELIPQSRGNRGVGTYGYYRYADSPYSMVRIKSGYFKEQREFITKNNLKNNIHYGWDFDYTRTKLFSQTNHQDGLFASFHYLNDIDYENLEQVNKTNDYEKNIESKLNYFYETQDIYGGVYFRYYLDSSKETNDATLQQLPVGHFHKFSNPLFSDKLLYSVDLKYENYDRKDGINSTIYNFNMPLSYTFSFFDDYLYLTLKEIIQSTQLQYSNTQTNFKDASLVQGIHQFIASTELVKPYSNTLHSINLDLTYSKPDYDNTKGDIYGVNTMASELAPFSQTLNKNDELAFGLNQSFFQKETLAQILNHKLKQAYTFDENGKSIKQNLDNEITVYYPLGSASNRLLYSHEDKRIIEYSSALNIAYDGIYGTINHYGTNQTPHSTKVDTESIATELGVNFQRFYTFSYKQTYDILNDLSNKEEYQFKINKRCWGLGIRYEDSLVASSSYDTYRQKMIYVVLELKPLGGFEQKYKMNKN